MKKVVELIKTNKKIIIIVSAVAVILVVFILGLLMLFGQGNKEKELTNLLEEMGKDFYENYFYDGLNSSKTEEEKVSYLKGLESLGIKIDLENLERFNSNVNKEKIKEFVNPKTNKECDKENTKIIIYPKSSYGKTDYTLKAELACGLDEK